MSEETTQQYQMPPDEIVRLVDAPATPDVSLSPSGEWMLILDRPELVPVAELARPELRIAGLRIDPGANAPSRSAYYTGLTLKRVSDGAGRPVTGVPGGGRVGRVLWSPDGARFAFSVRDADGVGLWVGEVGTGEARPLIASGLNAVFGTPFEWFSDSRTLVCRLVPEGRGAPPEPPAVPGGPVVQETSGAASPSRTFQDLLKNPYDEALFEYYGMSRAVRVDLEGACTHIGQPGILRWTDPSPNGAYVLAETVHRPFSYLVPYERFPRRVEVWDRDGGVVRVLADLPLAERVPIAFDAVPEGPRSFGWRSDAAATAVWVEAQDRGDPRVEAAVRDRVFALSAPFAGDPAGVADLGLRYAGISWESGALALVWERWWKTRRVRTWRTAPDTGETALLFDRSWEDRYADPGMPMLRRTPEGQYVLLTGADGQSLFLAGDGASPEGDRPFLDRLDLATGAVERLWRSQAPYFERAVRVLDTEDRVVLTCRESPEEPPNYFVRELLQDRVRQVTTFLHPTPQLAGVHKELIRYEREDGVQLTATLYLPPGYRPEEGPLPVLMWAYPREFKSADAAGQVKDSPYRFVRVAPGSHLSLLTQGYAILDGPTMPIVGEGEQEANDTYVAQLTASARAAVDELVRRGVGDRGRMVVGGHSYGGFMTANLLAHTDLFRAGVARSGAYNRTLTPFGFQAEERTLWEAPEVYAAMSPFMHAEKVKAPVLLIHGEADNNSGTFPIQSERFYNAIKGHGGTARLVMLPHESHGYRARESVLHVLWETVTWLDRYVKQDG